MDPTLQERYALAWVNTQKKITKFEKLSKHDTCWKIENIFSFVARTVNNKKSLGTWKPKEKWMEHSLSVTESSKVNKEFSSLHKSFLIR